MQWHHAWDVAIRKKTPGIDWCVPKLIVREKHNYINRQTRKGYGNERQQANMETQKIRKFYIDRTSHCNFNHCNPCGNAFTGFKQSQRKARATQCLNNLKQQGINFVFYNDDNNGYNIVGHTGSHLWWVFIEYYLSKSRRR